MNKKALLLILTTLVFIGCLIFLSVPRVFCQGLKVFNDTNCLQWSKPQFDSTKKTIVILAQNQGTELFDLMAPFYMFNATQQANVYIVSEHKAPVLLVNSLFILPHFSFTEFESANIHPDVIVIPNLTVRLKSPPNTANVNWIKAHYTGSNIILSVCDGSATAAATGLYDGKPLTTHASDLATLKKQYPNASWVANTTVTESGNLYSTAGVSNAVEGSLTVIGKLFGHETMQKVLHDIRYPHGDIRVEHQSRVVNKGAMVKIGSKMIFRKSRKVGVLLTDNINEFELASVLDTYVRSFPKSINSITLNSKSVSSKYGLTLFPTAEYKAKRLNELHVIDDRLSTESLFNKEVVVKYTTETIYPIEACLGRIQSQYGSKFRNCVKLMLDYN
jgi:transcriptional regulator GlxA family with amidase domain